MDDEEGCPKKCQLVVLPQCALSSSGSIILLPGEESKGIDGNKVRPQIGKPNGKPNKRVCITRPETASKEEERLQCETQEH
jgi:hypothetical protein